MATDAILKILRGLIQLNGAAGTMFPHRVRGGTASVRKWGSNKRLGPSLGIIFILLVTVLMPMSLMRAPDDAELTARVDIAGHQGVEIGVGQVTCRTARPLRILRPSMAIPTIDLRGNDMVLWVDCPNATEGTQWSARIYTDHDEHSLTINNRVYA